MQQGRRVDPTPEEIEARAAEVRRAWTDRQRQLRDTMTHVTTGGLRTAKVMVGRGSYHREEDY